VYGFIFGHNSSIFLPGKPSHAAVVWNELVFMVCSEASRRANLEKPIHENNMLQEEKELTTGI
jgi:hypothetical protein